jgi:hypothetical protein
MTLSDRLEQARKQRTLDPEPHASLSGAGGAEEDNDHPPIEIVMLPVGLHSVVDLQPDVPAPGAARSCPVCHADGRIDLLDLIGRRTHLTCEHCGAMWQISTADPADLLD